uniref:Uncharacterized protein n=1 Tax=Meloidogyne enterolobii TaxID=390850 RepID=A0A6V7Y108_MELEN|nr:unnamed protein product [Meloidogyne enterolobii]
MFSYKTGAYLICFIEIFFILIFFLNSLLVLLQQKEDLDRQQRLSFWHSNYVKTAFLIESISLGISLIFVFLLIFGLKRNSSSLLIPHLIIQCFALFCLFFLLIIGTIALFTDFALFYRLLNIIPFNEFPGQSTVALSAESLARVYAFLFLYFLTFLLQFWFIKIIYNCNRYFAERNNYMLYCLAYSTPLKTLNSAR